MENEFQANLTEKEDINPPNIFKLDYEGQSLKDNTKFELWKTKMLSKYGNNAKLYKCKIDNLYFYCSIKNNYGMGCPSCQNLICYFCSNNTNSRLICCITGRFYYILFHDGFIYINSEIDKDFYFVFKRFLFPIYTFFYFIGIISKNLYHTLKRTKSDYLYNYYFKDDDASWAKVFLNGLIALVLSFIFILHDIYFKIFLLFISLFFKFYPIKFYLGIIKKVMDELS